MKNSLIKLSVLFVFLTLGIAEISAQSEIFRINQTYTSIKNIDVQGGSLNVSVYGSDRNDVMVAGFIKGSDAHKDKLVIEVETKGDALLVKYSGGDSFVGVSGEIRVLVPTNTSVNVRTQSGNIDLMSLNGTLFDVSSQSGNVLAMDITGKCRLHSVSGKVSSSKIVGNVTTSSLSSAVETSNVKGLVKISSSSGAIVVGNIEGDVIVKAGSASTKVVGIKGNLEVRTASGFSDISELEGNLDVTTASGSVSINKLNGYMDCETASGDVKANNVTLVKGADISTLSGMVSVHILNGNSDLVYDLSSVSGKLSAKGVTGERTIISGTGAILINGSTVSGNFIVE